MVGTIIIYGGQAFLIRPFLGYCELYNLARGYVAARYTLEMTQKLILSNTFKVL